LDALVFATPSGYGPTEVYKDSIALLQNRLAKETPYEVGQRLYRQGLGISDIPTAVYSDSDIAEAYRGFEAARLSAPEPSIVEDAIVYGTGITMGGNRIDPASIYKEPEPPCKTGSQCIGGKCPQCVVPEPAGWIYEDDEGRMMFSQMPQNPPLWEPVYRTAPKEKSDSKQTLQLALDALVKWQKICLAKSRSANELTIPTKAIFALTAALAQGEPK
jgi:hypothetical protein